MGRTLYPAIFKTEEVGYSVYFPNLPGCNTQGNTLEEAYEMASDALKLYLEAVDEQPIVYTAGIQVKDNEMLAIVELIGTNCLLTFSKTISVYKNIKK